jgi:hypothetical protein
MERLPLGDTPYSSIYFRDCTLGVEFIDDFVVSVFCLLYIIFSSQAFFEAFTCVDPFVECLEELGEPGMLFNGHWLVSFITIVWAVSGKRNAL